MAFLKAPELTDAGRALVARAYAGEITLAFTGVGMGSGTPSGSAAERTALVTEEARVGITSVIRNKDQVTVKAAFTNSAAARAFYWREVGLYARNPAAPDDRQKDILFCYQATDTAPEYIAGAASGLIEKILPFTVTVSGQAEVTAVLGSELYALQEDLVDHVERRDNPHGVTAAQAGAVAKTGDTMSGALCVPVVSGQPGAGDQLALTASDVPGERGAYVSLCKKNHKENPCGFSIAARHTENEAAVNALWGYADGRLVWNRDEVLGDGSIIKHHEHLTRKVNGVSPNDAGEITLDIGVKKVNGAAPDAGGNVSISAVPVGAVCYFGRSSAPAGFLVCNGAEVSRTTYAALFAVIGTAFGAGNGSSTFNLPNLSDRFPQGGASVGSVKNAGLPNITGSFGFERQGAAGAAYGAFYYSGNNDNWGLSASRDKDNNLMSFDASRSNGIYGASSTVQPPALVLLPMIKY